MNPITRGNVTITFQSHKEVTIFGKLVKYRKPKTFPVLRIDGQIAMSNSPQENLMMKNEAKSAPTGSRALVAGLGLGIILEELRKKRCKISVVEKNKNVVDAYREFKKKKVDFDALHLTTIEKYLETGDGGWDFIHLDTWYALDYEFLPHINWLIKMAKGRLSPKGRLVCWGYEDMIKHFVSDCLTVYSDSRAMSKVSKLNLDRLGERFPMVGQFAKWLKNDVFVDKQIAIDKAHLIAAQIEKFDIPLESVDDIHAVNEAKLSYERMHAGAV